VAKRGIKKRDYEKLDDLTINRVVLILEAEKPITKKVACEILNISYNTARLGRIIEEYEERIAYTKKRLKTNRSKPFTDYEIKEMVINYLSGDSITSIAKSLYRSTYVIKSHLESLNLPIRSKKATYHKPDLIPDEMISEYFEIHEYVWSARYNCVAQIMVSLGTMEPNFEGLYSIWTFGKHNQFAMQPWWELGKLGILKQFKLKDDEFQNTEQPNFNYRIK